MRSRPAPSRPPSSTQYWQSRNHSGMLMSMANSPQISHDFVVSRIQKSMARTRCAYLVLRIAWYRGRALIMCLYMMCLLMILRSRKFVCRRLKRDCTSHHGRTRLMSSRSRSKTPRGRGPLLDSGNGLSESRTSGGYAIGRWIAPGRYCALNREYPMVWMMRGMSSASYSKSVIGRDAEPMGLFILLEMRRIGML